jgi:hypothetical protein
MVPSLEALMGVVFLYSTIQRNLEWPVAASRQGNSHFSALPT